MIKIQSISDIITNSSSEVFVISTDKHAKVAEFIKDICYLFGVDVDRIMTFESAAEKGNIKGWGIKYKKGDLLIYSNYENSIPGIIMEIIGELYWSRDLPNTKPLNVKNLIREHLG